MIIYLSPGGGEGSGDFGSVTVKIYLNTLLATTDSPSVPLTVIPPPPKKKKNLQPSQSSMI